MFNNNRTTLNYGAYVVSDLFYTECFKKNEISSEVYMTFANKPTAESKFMFTYDLLKKYNKLPTQFKMTNPKNNKRSCKIRTQGNFKFQNQDYVSAFYEYNKSVMTAKVGSQDYVLALANRSAALYYLEEYNACICDIHHALATNYPNELIYKLYDREVKCLVKMGEISQAKLKLEEFFSYLTSSILPKEKKKDIEIKIKMFMKEFNKEEKNNNDNKKITIQLLGGPSKSIPALSKFIKIKYSETMGRCLTISTDVNPGDVLAIEKPYAGVLNSESFEHNCRNCFKHCLNGIPCLKCTEVIYCNEVCRDKSYKKGHKYECIIFTTFCNWPSMCHMEYLSFYTFLTTFCKLGLNEYISTVRTFNSSNFDSMMRGFNSNGEYLSDQFLSVYTLEGNETKRSISDLFIRHCYAAVMVSFIKLIDLEIPDNLLATLGESLVHIICIVSSNAHEITQPLKRKTWSLPGNNECMPVANLLMPVLSLLNHHCDPNVIRYNYNGTIIVRAIQPISKGSQLFDNYGKLYATHTKELRQEILSKQYFFHCKCEPCLENWPLYDILSKQQSECKITTNFNSNVFYDNSNKLYHIIAKMSTKKYDGLDQIQFLLSYLSFLHNNVNKPCKEYCDCQETIKEILYKTVDKFSISNN